MITQKIARAGETKLARTDLARVESDGTFEGYASLFGAQDLGLDVVMPGAFQKSLARQAGAAPIRMLFQHDPNQPIGVWEIIREDARGLYVKGQLTLGVARAREIHALIKAGGLNGLSIGFRTVRARRDPRTGVRQIFEVDLWEISVVTFPMLPQAQVHAVKAANPQRALPSTREFERWLMRDAGLSRKEARTVIRSGFSSLGAQRDAVTGRKGCEASPLEAIRRATGMLRPATQQRKNTGNRS